MKLQIDHTPLINHEQLLLAFGCKNKASLERLLRNQNVPFLYGNNGTLVTSVDAINLALGIGHKQPESIVFRRS